MIEKVVTKGDLEDFSDVSRDLRYWLSKSPAERVELSLLKIGGRIDR